MIGNRWVLELETVINYVKELLLSLNNRLFGNLVREICRKVVI